MTNTTDTTGKIDLEFKLLDIAFYLVILLYFLFLYVLTLGYGEKAAMLPLLVIYATLLMCVLGIAKTSFTIYHSGQNPVETARAWLSEHGAVESKFAYLSHRKLDRLVFYMVIIAVYGVLTGHIGVFTSTFVFTAGHARYYGERWTHSLAAALLLIGFMYLVFIFFLNRTYLVRDDLVLFYIDNLIRSVR